MINKKNLHLFRCLFLKEYFQKISIKTDLLFIKVDRLLKSTLLGFFMKSLINWLSKMLESMANAFIHPLKNDLPPSIGTHSYSSIPIKRKLRRGWN